MFDTKPDRALAEHEEAGWARWNRGRIKRANYGFAADREEEEEEENERKREKKRRGLNGENKESGEQDVSQQIPYANMGPRRIYGIPRTPM